MCLLSVIRHSGVALHTASVTQLPALFPFTGPCSSLSCKGWAAVGGVELPGLLCTLQWGWGGEADNGLAASRKCLHLQLLALAAVALSLLSHGCTCPAWPWGVWALGCCHRL